MQILTKLPAQSILVALLLNFGFASPALVAKEAAPVDATKAQSAPEKESSPQAAPPQATPATAEVLEKNLEDVPDKPFEAVWPEGWTTKVLPGPLTNSGKDLGGRRVRAMKVDNGVPTVIELTYFPRSDKGQSNLTEEIGTVLENIKNGYADKGFEAAVSPVQTTKLGKLDAREALVTVTTPAFKMLQKILLAQSDNYFYSLTFTGRQTQYEQLKPLYDKLYESLVLK